MKITKGLLKKIIAEECAAMEPMGPMGGESAGIMIVGGDEHDMGHGHSEEEAMHSPEDIEGLATRAMAAIHDLATAAGVELSTTVGTEEDMMQEAFGRQQLRKDRRAARAAGPVTVQSSTEDVMDASGQRATDRIKTSNRAGTTDMTTVRSPGQSDRTRATITNPQGTITGERRPGVDFDLGAEDAAGSGERDYQTGGTTGGSTFAESTTVGTEGEEEMVDEGLELRGAAGSPDSNYGAYADTDPFEDYFDEDGQIYDLGPDVSTRRGARQAQRADRRDLKRMAGSEPRQPGGLSQALSQGRQVRSDIRGGTGLSGLQQQAQAQRADQSAFEDMPAWVQAMDDTPPPRSRRRLAEYGIAPDSAAAGPPEAGLGAGGMASAVKGLGTAGSGAAASKLEAKPAMEALTMVSDALSAATPSQKRAFVVDLLDMLGVDPADLPLAQSDLGQQRSVRSAQAAVPQPPSPSRPAPPLKESRDPFKRMRAIAFNPYGSNRED
jgi:hypothetical protein